KSYYCISFMTERPVDLLLIEDNALQAQLLESLLRDTHAPHYELHVARTLSDALEKLAERRYDTVLLDLMLPDSQGIETFFRVRAAAPDTPLIVQSAVDDVSLAAKAVQSGAQD